MWSVFQMPTTESKVRCPNVPQKETDEQCSPLHNYILSRFVGLLPLVAMMRCLPKTLGEAVIISETTSFAKRTSPLLLEGKKSKKHTILFVLGDPLF